jgi:hypothetical protein
MDVILFHPKKNTMATISFENKVADTSRDIKNVDVITIKQDGTKQLSAVGRSMFTPYMLVRSHGSLTCTGKNCTANAVVPSFIPSIKSVQSIELARQVLNHYLSSFEGFVNKDRKGAHRSFDKVSSVSIAMQKKNFSSVINGKERVDVNEFFIDPAIIDSVDVDKKKSGIVVHVKEGKCAFAIDQMKVPSEPVLFCAKSLEQSDAYKLKSYLSIYKEQLESARGVNLGSKMRRINLAFSKAPTCRVDGIRICCKMNDDDTETCY